MFCKTCGKEINDNAVICPHCGCATSEQTTAASEINTEKKFNGLALAGFIVSLASLLINLWGIVGLTGMILSIVGLTQINKNGHKGKGLAITGIVVGAIGVVYAIYVIIVGVAVLSLL